MIMSLTWVIVARSSVPSVGHPTLKVGHSSSQNVLCWLHLDSIITQEAVPKVSEHGLEHCQVL
jgi:hypothetical protein